MANRGSGRAGDPRESADVAAALVYLPVPGMLSQAAHAAGPQLLSAARVLGQGAKEGALLPLRLSMGVPAGKSPFVMFVAGRDNETTIVRLGVGGKGGGGLPDDCEVPMPQPKVVKPSGFGGALPDVTLETQLKGEGQLRDLAKNPNLKGVDTSSLGKKTPRQLKAELTDEQFKTVLKHFEGRNLNRGK